MIQKIDMFTVKCDNCGKLFEDEINCFCAWNDESGALDNAKEADWIEGNEPDTHYCPDCYKFDEDDNLILKTLKKCKSTTLKNTSV